MIIIVNRTPDPDIPKGRHPTAVKMIEQKYITERNIQQLREMAPEDEKGRDIDAFTHSDFFQEHLDKILRLEKVDGRLSLPALHAVVIARTRREMLGALEARSQEIEEVRAGTSDATSALIADSVKG